MTKYVDYHVHSNHSCDGRFTIFQMCQRAIELGIEEIGFSDHVDLDPQDPGFGFLNWDRYEVDVKNARELFKDNLVVRKGVEIDYQNVLEGKIRKWLENKELDFTIGAVHYLEHELISNEFCGHKNLGSMYKAYFDEVIASIDSCLFDVIGHLDVPRKYINEASFDFEGFDYEPQIERVLEKIVEKQVYLEINSKPSLLDKVKIGMLPTKETVERYFGMGGTRVSLGSDAHLKEEVGGGIKEILDFLASLNGNKLELLFYDR